MTVMYYDFLNNIFWQKDVIIFKSIPSDTLRLLEFAIEISFECNFRENRSPFSFSGAYGF